MGEDVLAVEGKVCALAMAPRWCANARCVVLRWQLQDVVAQWRASEGLRAVCERQLMAMNDAQSQVIVTLMGEGGEIGLGGCGVRSFHPVLQRFEVVCLQHQRSSLGTISRKLSLSSPAPNISVQHINKWM